MQIFFAPALKCTPFQRKFYINSNRCKTTIKSQKYQWKYILYSRTEIFNYKENIKIQCYRRTAETLSASSNRKNANSRVRNGEKPRGKTENVLQKKKNGRKIQIARLRATLVAMCRIIKRLLLRLTRSINYSRVTFSLGKMSSGSDGVMGALSVQDSLYGLRNKSVSNIRVWVFCVWNEIFAFILYQGCVLVSKFSIPKLTFGLVSTPTPTWAIWNPFNAENTIVVVIPIL